MMTQRKVFRYFKTSPEIIRLAVMMYIRFPRSLRNVEDLLHERRIDIAMRQSGLSGTDSGQCSQPRSAGDRSMGCGRAAGGAAWTRSS